MKPNNLWSRICYFCAVCLLAGAAGLVEAGYTGHAAPRIRLDSGTPAEFVRALSLCVVADSILPIQLPVRIGNDPNDPDTTGGRLVLEVSPGAVVPANLRLQRGDYGSATLVEQTSTRLVFAGFWPDLELGLRNSGVRVNGIGAAVYTGTFCNRNGVCTQVRSHIQFVANSSSIKTSQCDAPPLLRAADDNGPRGDDDYTSAQPLRFDVASSASTVTLLRDGVAIDTRAVSHGTATLQDTSAPTAALHAYQVRHGSGVPSAARYVERHLPPGAPVSAELQGGSQAAAVLQQYAAPLRVRLLDAIGQPVPDFAATLTLTAGAGGANASFAGGATVFQGQTDATGELVAPPVFAGTVTGVWAVRLNVAELPAVQVPMRVNPGPVASIVKLSGDLQQASVSADFELPIRVRARDAFGNAASGAQIVFEAPASAPTAWINPSSSSSATRMADANGEASVALRAALSAGMYELRVSANDGAVFFGLENLAEAPTTIQATTPTALVGLPPGSNVSPRPTVRVLNNLQQPMPGIRVAFTQIEGTAVLTGASSLTDSNGIASLDAWQLGIAPGSVSRVQARVFGLAPIEFSARVRVGVDVGVSVTNGRSQLFEGETVSWTVQVANAGPELARGTGLLLDPTGIAPTQWRCFALSPSACSATAGTGVPELALDVAANDVVVVELDGEVTAAVGGEAGVAASIQLAAGTVDVDAADDTAEDIDDVVAPSSTLFIDGFEATN
jgi:hypothetical protein